MFILLLLEKKGAMYGYALGGHLEKIFGLNVSLTSIYKALKIMQSEGYIEVEERVENNRLQKIYSITPKGKKILKEKRYEFKERIKRNLVQFFSVLEAIAGEQPHKPISKEESRRIFSLLKKISFMSIVAIHQKDIDPKEVEEILTSTLGALKQLTAGYNISLPYNLDL